METKSFSLEDKSFRSEIVHYPNVSSLVWSDRRWLYMCRTWMKTRQFCEGYFEINRLIVSLVIITLSFSHLRLLSLTLIDIQTFWRPQPWHHQHPYTHFFVRQPESKECLRLRLVCVCVLIQFSNCGNFVLILFRLLYFALIVASGLRCLMFYIFVENLELRLVA